MNLHIVPLNDLKPHDQKGMCECGPRIEIVNGSQLIIHNSFDGREGVELAMEVLEKKKIYSRCCGRCNGHSDLCVSDQECDKHNITGCEVCFGPRGDFHTKPKESDYPGIHFYEYNITD